MSISQKSNRWRRFYTFPELLCPFLLTQTLCSFLSSDFMRSLISSMDFRSLEARLSKVKVTLLDSSLDSAE